MNVGFARTCGIAVGSYHLLRSAALTARETQTAGQAGTVRSPPTSWFRCLSDVSQYQLFNLKWQRQLGTTATTIVSAIARREFISRSEARRRLLGRFEAVLMVLSCRTASAGS